MILIIFMARVITSVGCYHCYSSECILNVDEFNGVQTCSFIHLLYEQLLTFILFWLVPIGTTSIVYQSQGTPCLFFTFPIIFILPQTIGLNIYFLFHFSLTFRLNLHLTIFFILNYYMYIVDIGKMSSISLTKINIYFKFNFLIYSFNKNIF